MMIRVCGWLLTAAAGAFMVVASPAPAQACPGAKEQMAIKKVNPKEVMALQKAKAALTVVDASSQEARSKLGVIPGALLLTTPVDFDPAKELPAQKDQKLVFYCSTDACPYGDWAAARASEAGYTDVAVMPEGVAGWKSAGFPVSKSVPRS